MKRRTILKLAALSLVGGRQALAAPPRRESADLVVIGSGGAGFAAAITAHDLGAKVVVLEKMPITGGNTQLAAGGMNAAGTRFQAAKGIKDSWENMYEDTMKGGRNRGIPALVEILARNSAASVDWMAGLGADLTDIGRSGGARADRTHRPTGGAVVGAHLAQVLKRSAAQRGLDVRVNSRVLQILDAPGGGVRGVTVQNKLGVRYTIDARVVVLAAGGFGSNLERVAKYQPTYRDFSSTNQPGATGDGIDLAVELGAQLRDMAEIQIHPTQAAGSKILITETVRGNGAILVNREGKRFVNEVTTRDAASAAVLKQTGGTAFLIFDEVVRKSLAQIEGYFHLDLVKGGDTPEALAQTIGMNSGEPGGDAGSLQPVPGHEGRRRVPAPRHAATDPAAQVLRHRNSAGRALHDGRGVDRHPDAGAEQGREPARRASSRQARSPAASTARTGSAAIPSQRRSRSAGSRERKAWRSFVGVERRCAARQG